ncbi:MAG: zinc-ribbon domain-containing protein [Lachnospiraceae bacterium]
MDFLSKVSAKAGETFQTIKDSEVTKKAKNYAEIPGLQMQVGKCESLIKKAYEEIGEAYFNAHEHEEDGEYAEQFKVIKENKEKIGQLKSEIEDKKKGDDNTTDAKDGSVSIEKVCPICGRSVPDDSAFCSVCGHQF